MSFGRRLDGTTIATAEARRTARLADTEIEHFGLMAQIELEWLENKMGTLKSNISQLSEPRAVNFQSAASAIQTPGPTRLLDSSPDNSFQRISKSIRKEVTRRSELKTSSEFENISAQLTSVAVNSATLPTSVTNSARNSENSDIFKDAQEILPEFQPQLSQETQQGTEKETEKETQKELLPQTIHIKTEKIPIQTTPNSSDSSPKSFFASLPRKEPLTAKRIKQDPTAVEQNSLELGDDTFVSPSKPTQIRPTTKDEEDWVPLPDPPPSASVSASASASVPRFRFPSLSATPAVTPSAKTQSVTTMSSSKLTAPQMEEISTNKSPVQTAVTNVTSTTAEVFRRAKNMFFDSSPKRTGGKSPEKPQTAMGTATGTATMPTASVPSVSSAPSAPASPKRPDGSVFSRLLAPTLSSAAKSSVSAKLAGDESPTRGTQPHRKHQMENSAARTKDRIYPKLSGGFGNRKTASPSKSRIKMYQSGQPVGTLAKTPSSTTGLPSQTSQPQQNGPISDASNGKPQSVMVHTMQKDEEPLPRPALRKIPLEMSLKTRSGLKLGSNVQNKPSVPPLSAISKDFNDRMRANAAITANQRPSRTRGTGTNAENEPPSGTEGSTGPNGTSARRVGAKLVLPAEPKRRRTDAEGSGTTDASSARLGFPRRDTRDSTVSGNTVNSVNSVNSAPQTQTAPQQSSVSNLPSTGIRFGTTGAPPASLMKAAILHHHKSHNGPGGAAGGIPHVDGVKFSGEKIKFANTNSTATAPPTRFSYGTSTSTSTSTSTNANASTSANTSTKTPVSNRTSQFKPSIAGLGPVGSSEPTVLPEIYSDSDDDDDGSVIKDWANSPELRSLLQAQQAVDPDTIFGPVAPLQLEEVFKSTRVSRFRSRSSSANWTGKDALTHQEVSQYAREMGYKHKG